MTAPCDWATFDPDAYRADHYATLRADDAQILGLVARHFAAAGLPPGRDGLDVGTGSNLAPTLALLPFCRRVTQWEYGEQNLAWLRRVQRDGLDFAPWRPFWDCLTSAAPEPYKAINDPAWAVRSTATARHGSVHELPPQRWEAGTMFFVAESHSTRLADFAAAVRRFVAALTPGSPFALACMTGSTGYQVGDERFPAVPVGQAEAWSALRPVARDVVMHRIDSNPPVRPGVGMLLAVGRAGWVTGRRAR